MVKKPLDFICWTTVLVKAVQTAGSPEDLYTSCNRLYADNKTYDVTCNQTSRKLEFEVWHKRLGRAPISKLQMLPIDIVFPKRNHDMPCDICPKAKQQRLPFHLSTISTAAAFELIHIDTWGPYHTKTYSGHRFFLTIVDDYSRATWTHLMVTKDEALGLIKSFVKMAQTQFSSNVKIIRSDNALELSTSNAALDFFTSTGIMHQTCCV